MFRHVKRLEEERLVKIVYRANVEGNRGRGRETSEKIEEEVKFE